MASPSRKMPVVDPGTSEGYLRDVEAPWLAYWLKGKGKLSEPDAYLYDTGAKQWRSFDKWPATDGATRQNLYLHAGGALSFTPAAGREAPFDEYVSDPAHPVPYRPRPMEQTYDSRGSNWRTWETQDQRFVDGRPDVATWVSQPLTDDVLIAGDVTAKIFASTTGRDADWAVKLIDVFPDSIPDNWQQGGYELMVAHEIMRGRYRKSFSAPAPLTPRSPARVHGRPPPAGLHVQEGPPDHGADPEHLVSGLRSQSADVGAEHLQGESLGLPLADPSRSGTRRKLPSRIEVSVMKEPPG